MDITSTFGILESKQRTGAKTELKKFFYFNKTV